MKKISAFSKVYLFSFVFLILINNLLLSEPLRWGKNLSGSGWQLWLDHKAQWINDPVFTPPVDISKLPVNPPSCGWENFDKTDCKKVAVPGTVEEYFWGANGNPVGIAGDYRGVSWWSRKFTLDSGLKGKKIILAFESVNLCAEIFVNRKLVGYDAVGNTPFDVDITDAADFQRENSLDIRITDAGGNFSWPAHTVFKWGDNNIPIVRGFGGITGDIVLKAVDAVYIDDIYVRNKPKIKEAEIFTVLKNTSETQNQGVLIFVIKNWKNPSETVWQKTMNISVPAGGLEVSVPVYAPKAKEWGVLDPNLYIVSVTFRSKDGKIGDSAEKRFGFRWFDIAEKDGDARLYLNGKRVFLMASVNRGYWPSSGLIASPELAKKDVETAVSMGYNSIAFHNAIGQPQLLKAAEEAGLICTGESGGYRINEDNMKPCLDKLTRDLRREKLVRFVKRDRSSPALVLYMLKNEDQNKPDDDDLANMELVRKLDPSRILLYTGDRDRSKPAHINDPNDPMKLFYKPVDPKKYYHGWWDMHHWNPVAGYLDDYYRNPRNYLRYTIYDCDSTYFVPKDEIIFYGEEGAFGTMLRLGKIKEEIEKKGTTDGWREKEHLDWYKSYDAFLDESGFRTSFPTVDDFTKALGANMHYFHGRILENARISNVIDAYNLNGWASAATHTDMADVYRNPTGDPSIMKYYNQSLYTAVKIRNKVLPKGACGIVDFYIVNEKNLKGSFNLDVEFKSPAGQTVFSKTFPVNIRGGEDFGQLLVENVTLPAVETAGYYRVNARITGKNGTECTGYDDIFAVDYKSGGKLTGTGAVIDTSGAVIDILKEARGVTFGQFSNSLPQLDYIIVGKHNPRELSGLYRSVMEQVINGAVLIVLDHADWWADQMDDVFGYQAVQYNGCYHWGSDGRLFVGKSKLLKDLPISQSMNWEYQELYRGDVWGLDIGRLGNETVVGLAAQNRKDILTAVARIPFGNGQIILSTLSIIPELNSKKPESAAVKKLFLNFLDYAKQ